MTSFQIIVAEDDAWYADFLCYQLELIPEYAVQKASSGKELLQMLSTQPNVITLDYSLPDLQGLKLLKEIRERSPMTDVIVISGQNDVGVAVELLREGAFDYIVKDVDTKERLWNTVAKIKERQQLKGEIKELRNEVISKYSFGKLLIGQSESFISIFRLLEKAAQSSINVSITGETGTGKEVVAKAIHYNSDRSKQKFVAINIAAIPSELIESELFGHEKGAFTGAVSQRLGKFEEAQNGTLFIDEIGELDLNNQAKLLRVLQEREIQRLGSNKVISVNCRVICATHKNLEEEVEKGTFRQDLYYRLIGLPIKLPPLRERGEDILVLTKHFIALNEKETKRTQIQLSEGAREKLINHTYPGNIRELKSVIDLACVMCENNIIAPHDITFMGNRSITSLLSTDLTLKEINRRIIEQCLEDTGNDIPAVAKKLAIGKSSIYRLLKENK